MIGTIIVSVPTVNVRLVPGPSRGRVEVRNDGVWGTVCDDNFDTTDGKVICRMLGFSTATTVFTASNPGENAAAAAIASHPMAGLTPCTVSLEPAGTGKIWLDDLRCLGSETDIFNCRHAGLGANNCGHNEDAGVQCI